jgi:RNA polymerase sigma factor (sigma-70 family)
MATQAPSGADPYLFESRFRRALIAYFSRRLADPAEAEDLVQEVFIRLHRAQHEGGDVASEAYIFTVASNILRDRYRSDRRRERNRHVEWSTIDDRESALVEHRNPERVALGRDAIREVNAALAELPARTRDVFILFRFEGMSQARIAALYQISVSAVEKHVARALVHLSTRLAL